MTARSGWKKPYLFTVLIWLSTPNLFFIFLIDISDKYDLPWNLIAAISGVESGFCRNIPKFSYNCWGWANGNRYFTGFEDALETVASGLKQIYFDRGLTTPELDR